MHSLPYKLNTLRSDTLISWQSDWISWSILWLEARSWLSSSIQALNPKLLNNYNTKWTHYILLDKALKKMLISRLLWKEKLKNAPQTCSSRCTNLTAINVKQTQEYGRIRCELPISRKIYATSRLHTTKPNFIQAGSRPEHEMQCTAITETEVLTIKEGIKMPPGVAMP